MLGKPVPDFSLASTGATTFKLSGTRSNSVAPYLLANQDNLGASRDSLKSHKRLRATTSSNGRKVRGIRAQRSSLSGDARPHEWRGVKVPGHVQEVLNFVKAL
jgi:thioredoxin-dependent peroxiredoxin